MRPFFVLKKNRSQFLGTDFREKLFNKSYSTTNFVVCAWPFLFTAFIK